MSVSLSRKRADLESEITDQAFAHNAVTRVPDSADANSESSQDLLLQQAEAAARRLDASMGSEYDQHSACIAASAACLAKGSGLSRIDHIVLSVDNGMLRKGKNLFVIQGALND